MSIDNRHQLRALFRVEFLLKRNIELQWVLLPLNMKKLLLIASLLLTSILAHSQTDKDLIQFSGIIVEQDSLRPVPFVNIMVKGNNRGTMSDYFGYFSFVAQGNDTIIFSSVGYKKASYIIPDSLSTNKYSLIQVLRGDTILLKETVIYPWPTKEQFKEAFLKLDVPDDDMERARKNLARAEMKERMDGMPMDGSMNYNYAMQQQYSRLYYAGQLPPNNLLNPIAWAKFIQAWKNGDFKKK